MHRSRPRLLVVAHGTASPAGSATTASLVDAVRTRRPDTDVDLCFLDVASPRLADALDDRPTVVVPLLLSTGFHVQTDIPSAAAAFTHVRVAGHLGPDPLVVDALVDRLSHALVGRLGDGLGDGLGGGLGDGPTSARATVLVAAGSSRPEAIDECRIAATDLQRRLSGDGPEHPVTVATMADDLDVVFARQPEPFQVATYLLAEGSFVDRLTRAVHDPTGPAAVAPPIGAHPALVELVWKRYDTAEHTR